MSTINKQLPSLEYIQELYNEARNLCIQESKSDAWLWERHFAMLIIERCVELTLDYKNEDHYNGWLDYRDEIKKHFGIE